MKKTLYTALLAAGMLGLAPLHAAQVYPTQAKAAEAVTDDGYILAVHAKGWDRYSEALCKKLVADPKILEAAGSAAIILAPFYQYSSPDDRAKQAEVWGSLREPSASSMETYPSLLMYDKSGFLYGRVQGTLLHKGSVDEIAAEVKAKLEAKRQQEAIMKQADAASGVERARLIAQACEFKGIERPAGYRDKVRNADPNDESGMVKRLNFDPWGFVQKYCGKKSDGGLELPVDETVRIMEEHLKDPAYTPEQKQVFHAVIIGTLRRSSGAAASTQIRGNILEMKRLDPESHLGVSADQAMKIWLGGDGKKK